MPSPFQTKKNLEKSIKQSYVSSGGMRVKRCKVDIDNIGLIKISMALNPGSLPAEVVEELIYKTFDSVGVKAFVKDGWNDIRIDQQSPSVVRVNVEGYM